MLVRTRRPRLAALVVAAVLLLPLGIAPAASDEPADVDVFVIVVDGLEPEDVTPALTPNLAGLLDAGEARTYDGALANMITETNANHVAMVTGAYGGASGAVANGFFDQTSGEEVALERPSLNLSQTLFDVMDAHEDLRSAVVMGKAKLRALFDCTRDEGTGECGPSDDNPEGREIDHVRPDVLAGSVELGPDFDPEEALFGHDAAAEPASGSGYTLDARVMDIVLDLEAEPDDPDFTFVNLGGVDGMQHLFGAKSPEGRVAVLEADRNIGRLVDHLQSSGEWERSVVFVTADHSFEDTGDPVGTTSTPTDVPGPDVAHANPVTPQLTGSIIALDELLGTCDNGVPFHAASHAGSASVYITEDGYDPYDGGTLSSEAEACLAELHDRALERDGVTGAFYRDEGSDDPMPDDWNLSGSPRIGELVLTADADHAFVPTRAAADSVVSGTHGGPGARPIPFLVASGSTHLNAGTDAETTAEPVHAAPTVAWLLGIAEPEDTAVPRLEGAFSERPG